MRRGEDGAAVVVAMALTALLLLVAVLGGGAVAIFAAHRQAQAAADLAALAGAAAAGTGRAACAEVARVAEQNHALVLHCAAENRQVFVVVERRLPGALSARSVRARARAGPASP